IMPAIVAPPGRRGPAGARALEPQGGPLIGTEGGVLVESGVGEELLVARQFGMGQLAWTRPVSRRVSWWFRGSVRVRRSVRGGGRRRHGRLASLPAARAAAHTGRLEKASRWSAQQLVSQL